MKKIINPNTPSFIPEAKRIGIDNYIGENPDNINLIEETIRQNKVVLIDAPTSSGKSTLMGDLLKKWVFLENRLCFYLLPKKIQQQQFASTYLKGFPVINADAPAEVRQEGRDRGANITWSGFLLGGYDKDLTEDDIVIVDEAHLLINNQSYIPETKNLIRKLIHGKYKVVLLSGTPNYLAFQEIFGAMTLSFYFRNTPQRRILPCFIDGKMMDNVTHYLRTLDFNAEGLHIIRVNNKELHTEIVEWAKDVLHLSETDIQVINKDIADPRWMDADYRYLLDMEAIPPHKKLLITTVFADEGINIKNTNVKSIGIFYDPKQVRTSQRCRDSVVQFCARFRNLSKMENFDDFRIRLFIPDAYNDTETHDYYQVYAHQKKSGNILLAQLIDTRNKYGRQMVMQSYPMLLNSTDPTSNLVVEVADGYFEANKQGVFFNTKNQIDLFKSNSEFLEELAAYFEIDEPMDYVRERNIADAIQHKQAKQRRMIEKVEEFRCLRFLPEEVLHRIAKEVNNPIIRSLVLGLNADDAYKNNGHKISKSVVHSIEDDAARLLILKNLSFPIDLFAGLLLHKREFHAKMTFLRYLLSRAINLDSSMDNVYYISLYLPLYAIEEAITKLYIGNGYNLKARVQQVIGKAMPYGLKLKNISASQLLDNLFITREKRMTEGGKKGTYVTILRPKTISDIVLEFLFLNEQHYPTIEDLSGLASDYADRKQEYNAAQGTLRALNGKESDATEQNDDLHLAQARKLMENSKDALMYRIFTDPTISERADQITNAISDAFRQDVQKISGTFNTLEGTVDDAKMVALLPAA